jgi:ABC-type branched-subunit amino acid transport system substrate-binding protein
MTSSLRVIALALLLAFGALLPGACNRYGAGDSHQIGHLAPRSGPDQAAGQQLIAAVGMVVNETNHDDANRIDNRPITVIHADAGPDVNGFAFQTTRLLSVNHVEALLGGVNTAQLGKIVEAVLAQSPLNAAVTVSPCGGLGGPPNKLVWSVGLSPAERGKWLARGAVEHAKVTEVLTVTDTRDPVFAAIRGGFENEFRHPERQMNSSLTFVDAKGLPELAKRIATAKPKSILFCGRGADLLKLRDELGAAKLDNVPVLFGGEEEESAFRKEPERSNGILYASAFTAEDKAEAVQKFVTDFRNRAGQPPDADAALSADAARVLFASARAAKRFLPKTLVPEMPKVELEVPTGKFSFTKEGEPRRPAYVLRLESGQPRLLGKYTPESK